SDKLPSVIGTVGGKPQIQLLNWFYYPLVSNYSGHAIAKNLDYVLTQFPNSMDTVEAYGIKKTILLASSERSRTLVTPVKVSWQSVQTEDDFNTFTKKQLPMAVLLEGKFQSLYSNRVSGETRARWQASG